MRDNAKPARKGLRLISRIKYVIRNRDLYKFQLACVTEVISGVITLILFIMLCIELR